MRERQIITRGIILNRTDYTDTSLILDVFSEDLGRISVIVKGAKREKRQDTGFYSLMNVLEWTLISQQSEMYILKSSNLLESTAMTEQWETFSLQCAGLELYRSIMVTHEEASEYYELLYSYLVFLPKITANGILIFWRFLLRVFQKMGIELNVKACAFCRKEDIPLPYYNSHRSGFVCQDCTSKLNEPSIPLDSHAANILHSLPYIGHLLIDIQLSKRETAEIQSIFLRHYEDHMHQKLCFKSLIDLLK